MRLRCSVCHFLATHNPAALLCISLGLAQGVSRAVRHTRLRRENAPELLALTFFSCLGIVVIRRSRSACLPHWIGTLSSLTTTRPRLLLSSSRNALRPTSRVSPPVRRIQTPRGRKLPAMTISYKSLRNLPSLIASRLRVRSLGQPRLSGNVTR